MAQPDDGLRVQESEQLPGNRRSRLATWIGLALLVLTLGGLVWFSVSNTETRPEGSPPIAPAAPAPPDR